jgi:hypothetical protein
MTMRRSIIALPFLIASAAAGAAEPGPALSGEVEVKLYADRQYRDTGSPSARRSDGRTETEARIALTLGQGFSLQSVSKLEAVREPAGNRLFGDHAGYVAELYANYDGDWFTLFAGKIHPHFGVAWDRAPGVYGKEFAEGYENTEKLGFGASLKLETLSWGTHEAIASVFKTDTSFLSQSYLSRPGFGSDRLLRLGRNQTRFGGVANTNGLESFTLALSGDEFAALPNFAYHLAYSQQPSRTDPNGDGGRAERGVAASAQYAVVFAKGFQLVPLIEWVGQSNADGLDQERRFLTVGAELQRHEWSISALRTDRWTKPRDAAALNDSLTTASIGYKFDFGVNLSLGWRRLREGGVERDAAGALAVYGFRF